MEHTGRYYEPIAQTHSRMDSLSRPSIHFCSRAMAATLCATSKPTRRMPGKLRDMGLTTGGRCGNIVTRYELKTLNRQFQLATKNKTAFANNLTSLLDASFPNARGFFTCPARKDGSQKWVDFGMTFWHVDCVRSVSLNAFAGRYRKWCKRHGYNFSAEKAEQIHQEARERLLWFPNPKPPSDGTAGRRAAFEHLPDGGNPPDGDEPLGLPVA